MRVGKKKKKKMESPCVIPSQWHLERQNLSTETISMRHVGIQRDIQDSGLRVQSLGL